MTQRRLVRWSLLLLLLRRQQKRCGRTLRSDGRHRHRLVVFSINGSTPATTEGGGDIAATRKLVLLWALLRAAAVDEQIRRPINDDDGRRRGTSLSDDSIAVVVVKAAIEALIEGEKRCFCRCGHSSATAAAIGERIPPSPMRIAGGASQILTTIDPGIGANPLLLQIRPN